MRGGGKRIEIKDASFIHLLDMVVNPLSRTFFPSY